MDAAICKAIAEQRYLRFYYEGGYRCVEPHRHGINPADGEVLRAYQIEGYSRSGKPQAWKLFEVAKIRELQVIEATFPGARPGYRPTCSAMAKVCCELHLGRQAQILPPRQAPSSG